MSNNLSKKLFVVCVCHESIIQWPSIQNEPSSSDQSNVSRLGERCNHLSYFGSWDDALTVPQILWSYSKFPTVFSSGCGYPCTIPGGCQGGGRSWPREQEIGLLLKKNEHKKTCHFYRPVISFPSILCSFVYSSTSCVWHYLSTTNLTNYTNRRSA